MPNRDDHDEPQAPDWFTKLYATQPTTDFPGAIGEIREGLAEQRQREIEDAAVASHDPKTPLDVEVEPSEISRALADFSDSLPAVSRGALTKLSERTFKRLGPADDKLREKFPALIQDFTSEPFIQQLGYILPPAAVIQDPDGVVMRSGEPLQVGVRYTVLIPEIVGVTPPPQPPVILLGPGEIDGHYVNRSLRETGHVPDEVK